MKKKKLPDKLYVNVQAGSVQLIGGVRMYGATDKPAGAYADEYVLRGSERNRILKELKEFARTALKSSGYECCNANYEAILKKLKEMSNG